MISVRRTAAMGAAGALATGIVLSGVGLSAAGAATYPPVTPTPTETPVNPGTVKCKAKAVQSKDRIRVSLTATGDAAKFKNFTFKIQKYLKSADAWQVNNIVYNIEEGTPRVIDRERGRYRAKCFGPNNAGPLTNKVRLTK